MITTLTVTCPKLVKLTATQHRNTTATELMPYTVLSIQCREPRTAPGQQVNEIEIRIIVEDLEFVDELINQLTNQSVALKETR